MGEGGRGKGGGGCARVDLWTSPTVLRSDFGLDGGMRPALMLMSAATAMALTLFPCSLVPKFIFVWQWPTFFLVYSLSSLPVWCASGPRQEKAYEPMATSSQRELSSRLCCSFEPFCLFILLPLRFFCLR